MKTKLLLLFAFICWAGASAQIFQYKKLSGNVTNTNLEVEGIHVINKTTRSSTITDANGHFEIGVRLKDTIVLSAIQYNLESFIVTPDIYDKGTIDILLTEKVNELEEVVVSKHKLSGDLSKDMKDADIKPDINFYDVGIPGYKGKREERIISTMEALNYGIPTSINLDALYKNISGYYKNLRTRRGWDKENEAILDMINFYGLELFTKTYGIPESNIYPFVLHCVVSSEAATLFRNQDHAAVLDIFESKSGDFKE